MPDIAQGHMWQGAKGPTAYCLAILGWTFTAGASQAHVRTIATNLPVPAPAWRAAMHSQQTQS